MCVCVWRGRFFLFWGGGVASARARTHHARPARDRPLHLLSRLSAPLAPRLSPTCREEGRDHSSGAAHGAARDELENHLHRPQRPQPAAGRVRADRGAQRKRQRAAGGAQRGGGGAQREAAVGELADDQHARKLHEQANRQHALRANVWVSVERAGRRA